jgi:SNF2 family DNA or RNA helicase
VWAVFKENYAAIRQVCNDLELQFVEVHGDVSAKAKQDAVKRFDSDPACRVLVGHPGSGGIGVNLVAASYSIFYSRGFSLEFDLQAEARNFRGGSERHETIVRIDLVAPGTIDEQVMQALAAKQAVGETLVRGMVGKI